MIIKSAPAKRVLAAWLKEHDPEMLEVLTEFGPDFGPLTIEYEHKNPELQADLYRRLDEARHQVAQDSMRVVHDALSKARGNLGTS